MDDDVTAEEDIFRGPLVNAQNPRLGCGGKVGGVFQKLND